MDIATKYKFVFICGLHRSGTTLLTDILGKHSCISSFKNTGAIEDEGQFLQSIYPIAKKFGGPGKFAFSKEMHLTEESDLISKKNIRKIFDEWSNYWDLSKEYLIEKSPPNLLKMRFLQRIFPNSFFIVILRNPIAVTMATKKWCNSSTEDLLKHWFCAHSYYLKDKVYIKNILEIKYENLISNYSMSTNKIFSFLGLKNEIINEKIRLNVNNEYLNLFLNENLKEKIKKKEYFDFKKYGYSL